MVRLMHTASKKPQELSGSQRIALALVVEPKVLLLDESLGALDMKLRRQLQTELDSIQKRIRTRFVHVTHDQKEAMAIADKIVVMNHGSIEDIGEPDRIYLCPKTLFTTHFTGKNNLLEGRVKTSDEQTITIATAIGEHNLSTVNNASSLDVGADVTLSIRPEHLCEQQSDGAIDPDETWLQDIGFLGTQYWSG